MTDPVHLSKFDASCDDLASCHKSLTAIVDEIKVSIAQFFLELKDIKQQKVGGLQLVPLCQLMAF